MLTPRNSFYRSAVLASAFLPLLVAPKVSAQPPPLTLTLELDDSTYLVGQPIVIVLSLTNRGAVPFEDLASMDPSMGNMGFILTDIESGAALPYTGQMPPFRLFSLPGTTLSPGRESIHMTRLDLWFGDRDRGGFELTRCLQTRLLPPGRYRLSAGFRPKENGGYRGLLSNAVVFEVVPIETNPSEEKRVSGFLARCPAPGDRRLVNSYCNELLPQFYGSRYLALVLMNAGPAGSVPIDTLLSVSDRYDPNPGRRAFLINHWCKRQGSVSEKLPVVERLLASEHDKLSRRVLEQWRAGFEWQLRGNPAVEKR